MEIEIDCTVHVYLPKKIQETGLKRFIIATEVNGKEYYFSSKDGTKIKTIPGVIDKEDELEWAFKLAGDKTKKSDKEIEQILEELKEKFKVEEEQNQDLEVEFFVTFYRSLTRKEFDLENLFRKLLQSDKFSDLYNQFTEKIRVKNEVKYLDIKFETTKAVCLNETNKNRVSNLFDGKNETYLESDCDEQLLIFIPLNQKTRVKQLIITSKGNDTTPKTLKIFKNKKDMDFDSIDDHKPTQVITLQKVEGDQVLNLDFVSFQDVHFLTIFVQDNFGSETTQISGLRLIGENLLTVKNLDNLTNEHQHN